MGNLSVLGLVPSPKICHHIPMSTRYFSWGLLVCVALGFSLPSMAEEKPTVSEEAYADLMANEVLDLQDLADGAEIQRRMFNHITPSGFSWLQPMFPSVAPFDSKYFDEAFLDGLLGQDTNSVAVYPLSLVLDPKTRETLVYNAEGELIASVPSDGISRTWPENADPARVTLKIDLLPTEDVEPYLYVEDRISESLASVASKSAKTPKAGGVAMRSLTTGQFGIADIQRLTNGNFRLTVTNGTDVAEVFSYTVWHTSSVVVVTWTNEESNVVTDTNTLWTPVSSPFNGLESEWDFGTTNLVLANGVGVWEDLNISSNARVRFYGVAERADSDWDGLSDGEELFVYHTCLTNADTDGDGWNDGEEIAAETDPLDRFSATHLAKGVVMNEVLYNPDGADAEKEWIELYSASRYPVELSGFSIQVASNDFSDALVFPTNSWIQPGHCLLIGGTSVSNRDHTASLTMPNCFTNEPTGAVRLVAVMPTNTLVADTLMYGGNPSVFNANGLDTTGWLSTNAPWASSSNSVVRWFAGLDSDRRQDWTWATTPTPTSSTNALDSDGDGLTDQQELTGCENPYDEPTNQHNPDSDGDGLGDYVECETYSTDPNTWATDGDLFPWPPTNNFAVSNWWGSDSYELANGWDPLIYDENTNEIPDSWEMAFPGTNLYADADGDGVSNYDELDQNSDPFSTNSVSPEPYVVVYQSSKPGWVNNGLVDVGLNGWVKIYFLGLKTNTSLCVWVKECSTQEEFRVEWFDATLNGSVWLNENREVITSASADTNSRPYLLIQDLGWHPDFSATLGGEYTNAMIEVDYVEIDGAPSDGLVVKNGDNVTFVAHILPSDFVPPSAEPKWYYQKLKSDGTWEAWANFGANAYGAQYIHTASESGIFRVKTVLSVGGLFLCEKVYERTADEAYGPGVAGEPDAFGVTDTQIQIDIRDSAKGFLGSTAYPYDGIVSAQYGFPEYPADTYKCNIFVAHRAEQAGADVPAINGVPATYPPLANEWAGTEDTHPLIPGFQTDIDGWTLIPSVTYPQPGFIVGHPNASGSGHVGIVDNDGNGIGAGVSGTVNKDYTSFLDGTSGFRKYEP